jgi:hypothetical protein
MGDTVVGRAGTGGHGVGTLPPRTPLVTLPQLSGMYVAEQAIREAGGLSPAKWSATVRTETRYRQDGRNVISAHAAWSALKRLDAEPGDVLARAMTADNAVYRRVGRKDGLPILEPHNAARDAAGGAANVTRPDAPTAPGDAAPPPRGAAKPPKIPDIATAAREAAADAPAADPGPVARGTRKAGRGKVAAIALGGAGALALVAYGAHLALQGNKGSGGGAVKDAAEGAASAGSGPQGPAEATAEANEVKQHARQTEAENKAKAAKAEAEAKAAAEAKSAAEAKAAAEAEAARKAAEAKAAGPPTLRGAPAGPLTVKNEPADAEQVGVIHAVLDVGLEHARRAGFNREQSNRLLITAIRVISQESTARNLVGGDRDSVGVFQQRASMGWPASRDVRRDANEFYNRLTPLIAQYPKGDLGFLGDWVQRSYTFGTPQQGDDYNQWAGDADLALKAFTE